MNDKIISKTENRDLMKQAREALAGNWARAIGTFLFFIAVMAVVSGLIDALFTLIFYGADAFGHDKYSEYGKYAGEYGWQSGLIKEVPRNILVQVLGYLVTGPIGIGLALYSLSLSRKSGATFSQGWAGFKKFKTGFGVALLYSVLVVLWSLLLIVPGIIAAIRYSAAYLLIADGKASTPREAIRASKELMDGNKAKLFKLWLRFLGWFALSVVTLGIGFLWFIPYASVSHAKFYEDLQKK